MPSSRVFEGRRLVEARELLSALRRRGDETALRSGRELERETAVRSGRLLLPEVTAGIDVLPLPDRLVTLLPSWPDVRDDRLTAEKRDPERLVLATLDAGTVVATLEAMAPLREPNRSCRAPRLVKLLCLR